MQPLGAFVWRWYPVSFSILGRIGGDAT